MDSFQVAVPWPQDFREIWENVTVRTRHRGFDNHVWLIKIINYRIPRLPFETAVCTFFPTTFFKNRGIIAFIRLGRVKCCHSFFCYVTRVQIDLQQNGTRSKRKTVQGHWKDSNLKMLWRSASITETFI